MSSMEQNNTGRDTNVHTNAVQVYVYKGICSNIVDTNLLKYWKTRRVMLPASILTMLTYYVLTAIRVNILFLTEKLIKHSFPSLYNVSLLFSSSKFIITFLKPVSKRSAVDNVYFSKMLLMTVKLIFSVISVFVCI